ncbi:uncharacterized protein TNIN_46471 [Trichonephila inaurata madagascariensis]|uniref:Uncharacterized protein n=1 Tax=Trichonephila inaurata madagascariensis TaxID=2747483 RepID=A0A8X6YWI6_9ARAC|nr:uncharacterized protein TNIN_46471 [Trichonephila inaurata madagascariensis]
MSVVWACKFSSSSRKKTVFTVSLRKAAPLKLNRFEDLSSDHDSTGEDSSSEEQDEILTTNEDQILPSQVTDRDYIFMPPLDESIDGNEENSNTGKWMLFPLGDLQKLDEFWVTLLPLYYEGILTGIKCSTALGSQHGVINCYTANSEDTSDVKKAADAIRDCTDYKYLMYYKTNEASRRGQYLDSGSSNISKYMHTVKKAMFEKDQGNRWKIIYL